MISWQSSRWRRILSSYISNAIPIHSLCNVEKGVDENYLPGACVCAAPIEESLEGTIVFDGLLFPTAT
jgi:hypothetical protein